ncbi:response regulator [bacterium]|nr:response regulator [bacterium]
MNKAKLNILILDDEKHITASLKRLLESTGYNVFTTNTSDDAIDIVRNKVIHIAILDILIPNMDGLTVLSIIKEISGLTQVIMMSAYSTVDRIVAALENGANDFLIKPFSNIEDLIDVVDRSAEKLDRWKDILHTTGAI